MNPAWIAWLCGNATLAQRAHAVRNPQNVRVSTSTETNYLLYYQQLTELIEKVLEKCRGERLASLVMSIDAQSVSNTLHDCKRWAASAAHFLLLVRNRAVKVQEGHPSRRGEIVNAFQTRPRPDHLSILAAQALPRAPFADSRSRGSLDVKMCHRKYSQKMGVLEILAVLPK